MKINRQLLVLAFCVAIPLLIVGSVNLYWLWHASRSELNHSLEQRAQLSAATVERWIDAQRQPLSTLATYYRDRGDVPRDYARLMVALRPHWTDLRIYRADQSIFYAEPPNLTAPAPQIVDELFQSLAARDEQIVVSDLIGETGDAVLHLAVPIEGGGMVVTRVRAAAMSDIFRDIKLSPESILTVFDPQGRIVYGSAKRDFIGKDISDSELFAALGENELSIVEGASPNDGVRRVHALARVRGIDYIVKVGTPSLTLYQTAQKQFAHYALYALLALISSLLIALYIARRITLPIANLSETAHRFGAGDHGARARVEEGGGEIAELSQAFNDMVRRIGERESRLNELNARLTELNERKSEVISGVSHELRTPLTTIKTMARVMMHAEQSEAERREALEIIGLECDRQIDLVLNLLDLSSIEAGTVQRNIAPASLAEILQVCLRVERHAAEARRHALEARLPATLPHVLTDRKALRRVLCALIENAIKYTPEGGRITVAARAGGEDGGGTTAEIEIRDTGRGIAREDLPHVFDKFYRGRSTIAVDQNQTEIAEVPGVGLGLYLARTIIEQLGGSVEVESSEGEGAAFTVRVPVWKNDETRLTVTEVDVQTVVDR